MVRRIFLDIASEESYNERFSGSPVLSGSLRSMETIVQPVILSGGSGTRLWPLSRRSNPKQFLPLNGPESLLADTVRRIAKLDTAG